VLLSADGRTAKVADVGAAAMMDAEYVSRNFGTLAWAAPELLLADRGNQLDEKVSPAFFTGPRNAGDQLSHIRQHYVDMSPCGAQADSYSLGVVIWELVTGETPVRGSMRPVRVPEECPAAVAALMQRCMAMAPADRPDADEVGRQLQRLAASAEL
jgi:serine/threonine protein kinase